MKNISRHYENLTSTQRIALAIEAMARGDMQEMDRLDSTCPRKSYYGIDREYGLGLSELHCLALLYENRILSWALQVHPIRSLLAERLSQDNDEADREVDNLIEMLQAIHADIRGWRAAWDEFCEGLGMDGRKVLFAFGLGVHPQAVQTSKCRTERWRRHEFEAKANALAAMTEVFATTRRGTGS